MPSDLAAAWTVLETEATGGTTGTLRSVPAGADVPAGGIDIAVDSLGRRHLIIPLLPGEAFAEDRSGRGVQLWRLTVDGDVRASVICLLPALNEVFERLAAEIISEVVAAPSPARRAAEVLRAWKDLLADAAGADVLGDGRLIGLLAELLCLELIVAHDPQRRVDPWSGPSGHQHDFRYGDHALEVKATSAREGRIVPISSVKQLDPQPASDLHLAFHRFEPAPVGSGETLPGTIARLDVELGVDTTKLFQRLSLLGYSPAHDDSYRGRPFVLTERRLYDVSQSAFPRITSESFVGGDLPPGTLQISYSIDLTNEPPVPLSDNDATSLWRALAGAPT